MRRFPYCSCSHCVCSQERVNVESSTSFLLHSPAKKRPPANENTTAFSGKEEHEADRLLQSCSSHLKDKWIALILEESRSYISSTLAFHSIWVFWLFSTCCEITITHNLKKGIALINKQLKLYVRCQRHFLTDIIQDLHLKVQVLIKQSCVSESDARLKLHGITHTCVLYNTKNHEYFNNKDPAISVYYVKLNSKVLPFVVQNNNSH